jgi:hypothetical protein
MALVNQFCCDNIFLGVMLHFTSVLSHPIHTVDVAHKLSGGRKFFFFFLKKKKKKIYILIKVVIQLEKCYTHFHFDTFKCTLPNVNVKIIIIRF